MFVYSELAMHGVSAASYLAGVGSRCWINVEEIADSRQIPPLKIAEALKVLVAKGLVAEVPSKGYQLARPAGEISVLQIVQVFDEPDRQMCPFGPQWCAMGPKCGLHDEFVILHQSLLQKLSTETLALFQHPEDSER